VSWRPASTVPRPVELQQRPPTIVTPILSSETLMLFLMKVSVGEAPAPPTMAFSSAFAELDSMGPLGTLNTAFSLPYFDHRPDDSQPILTLSTSQAFPTATFFTDQLLLLHSRMRPLPLLVKPRTQVACFRF